MKIQCIYHSDSWFPLCLFFNMTENKTKQETKKSNSGLLLALCPHFCQVPRHVRPCKKWNGSFGIHWSYFGGLRIIEMKKPYGVQRQVCLLAYVHAFKQNRGLESYNHLMPLGIFLPGRSGSGILFRDKFQLITTGLLNTPQGVISRMQRNSCSKILFCLSVCGILWTTSG